jgi:hypothetical protein
MSLTAAAIFFSLALEPTALPFTIFDSRSMRPLFAPEVLALVVVVVVVREESDFDDGLQATTASANAAT